MQLVEWRIATVDDRFFVAEPGNAGDWLALECLRSKHGGGLRSIRARAGVYMVDVNRIAYQGQTSNPVVIRQAVSAIHLGCRPLSPQKKSLFTRDESNCGKRKNALTALAYLKAQWQLVSPRGRRLGVIASPLDVGNPVHRTYWSGYMQPSDSQ